MTSALRPLHPAFGVEAPATWLDERPLPAKTLQEALDRHRLLLFRGHPLSDAEQIEVLACFGEPLQENPARAALHGFVSNTREDGILGEGAYSFHSDHAFMPDPIEVLSLQALEAPPSCGATRFADMVSAAASLPRSLRERAAGLVGRNVVDPGSDPDIVRMHERGFEGLPQALHPLLARHPRTGADTLFANEQQTQQVEGLPREESDALLEALFAHLYSDAHVYVHEWRPDDLVVWDNRALQHARPALSALPRTLRRVSVGGSSVFHYFERVDGPMHRLEEPERP